MRKIPNLLILLTAVVAVFVSCSSPENSYPHDKTVYTVTFDTMGHGKGIDVKFVENGNYVPEPAAISEDGYVFCGWYDSQSLTHKWMFDKYVVTKNMTLYAKWSENTYIVRFDGNGATEGSMGDQLFKYTEEKELSANQFIRKGCLFAGWDTVKEGSDVNYTDRAVVSRLTTETSITLYAQWIEDTQPKEMFLVTFNMQGHGKGIDAQYVTASDFVTKPADPQETGFTFCGWYKESSCTNDWKFNEDRVTSDTVLYAGWVENQYTIKFDGNGATSGSMQDQKVYFTDIVRLNKNTFGRSKWSFAGWDTVKEGSDNNFADHQYVSMLTTGTEITLYAQWIPEKIGLIGGTIYYVDAQNIDGRTNGTLIADDKEYWFFDSKLEHENIDLTSVKAGLVSDTDNPFADACYYACLAGIHDDVFFVLNPNHSYNYSDTSKDIFWCFVQDSNVISDENIDSEFGNGKKLTSKVNGNSWTYKFIPSDSKYYSNKTSVWAICATVNNGKLGGYTVSDDLIYRVDGVSSDENMIYDWYVPSVPELYQLRQYIGNKEQWLDFTKAKNISKCYTSCALSSTAKSWLCSNYSNIEEFRLYDKVTSDDYYSVVLIRSF